PPAVRGLPAAFFARTASGIALGHRAACSFASLLDRDLDRQAHLILGSNGPNLAFELPLRRVGSDRDLDLCLVAAGGDGAGLGCQPLLEPSFDLDLDWALKP